MCVRVSGGAGNPLSCLKLCLDLSRRVFEAQFFLQQRTHSLRTLLFNNKAVPDSPPAVVFEPIVDGPALASFVAIITVLSFVHFRLKGLNSTLR